MDIVVGIDGSPAAEQALGLALEEATLRGGRVVALMAYNYLDQPHPPSEPAFDPEYSVDDARRFLERTIERVVAEHDATGVEVEPRVVTDLPARALLEAAEGAAMVVVGSRGIGGFKGLLLGSVSQQVVTHAPCPVLVARPRT